jgi:ATP-dependent Lhr-like helicase
VTDDSEAAGPRPGRFSPADHPPDADRAPHLVSITAADPLNLVGILTPGGRLPALARNRVLFRDGVPVALREAGEVRFLPPPEPGGELPAAERWQAEQTLLRRPVPPKLRPYLGRSA